MEHLMNTFDTNTLYAETDYLRIALLYRTDQSNPCVMDSNFLRNPGVIG